ncbi:hypothetical protein C1H46_009106 [Malus baccata]|uniref:Uncharacterized protein n=1 Tax=Malus baccata TaxID=106549 RepID=A0A540N2L0_MALBA|nr:hypothetical protein C1H46_009106 [Malus baccata]
MQGYGRRSRSNLEMQLVWEKIEIEPGDAAAMGEDEGEGYWKRKWVCGGGSVEVKEDAAKFVVEEEDEATRARG